MNSYVCSKEYKIIIFLLLEIIKQNDNLFLATKHILSDTNESLMALAFFLPYAASQLLMHDVNDDRGRYAFVAHVKVMVQECQEAFLCFETPKHLHHISPQHYCD